MQRFFIFLIRNDVWIYILCGLALLWYLTEFVRASSSLRQAMFGLERETSLRARNSALFLILLFGSIAGIVAFVNTEIAPTIPAEVLYPPTPTPDPLSLPPSPTPSGPQETPTSPIAPTVTLPSGNLIASPGVPTATITSTTPAASPGNPITLPTPTVAIAGCSPTVTISDPRDGDVVVGTISFFGSANIPGFAYYELEINGPQTNSQWASLLGRRITQRVEDGLLATADLTTWITGPYQVRLTTANDSGQITNQCVITIELDDG